MEDERTELASIAATMGKLGGKARAETLTPERRSDIASQAAKKRVVLNLRHLAPQSAERPVPELVAALEIAGADAERGPPDR
jgi:hypothetical protein